VVGIVYARPPGPEFGDIATAGHRLLRRIRQALIEAGDVILRALHASRGRHVGAGDMDPDTLGRACRERGWALLMNADLQAAETLTFVREVRADLGLALGLPVVPPALCELPRLSCISVQPSLGGESPGQTELGLGTTPDVPSQIGVTVLRLGDTVHTSAVLRRATLDVQPYDTRVSLGLKAAVVGDDLVVETVRDLLSGPAIGTPHDRTTVASADSPRVASPSARPPDQRPRRYRAPRGRPAWKLLVRSTLYAWYLPARNWQRRLRKRFPIVILYHHLISDRPHPMGIPTEAFLAHLLYLKRHYRVLSLSEAVTLLESGQVAEPTVVLTLDDGYADNFLNLRAALRMEPTPVTFFVCSDLILHGGRFPVDVAEGRHDFRPLTPDELCVLAAEGIEIGSHTRTHFDCGTSDVERLRSEIIGSGEDLAKILGRPVNRFSFPMGRRDNVSPEAAQIARACYARYCSADGGLNWPGHDDRDLRRIPHPAGLWELDLALQGVLGFTSRLGAPRG